MVTRRPLTALVLALMLQLVATAQNYDVNDTVTEYPLKGTFYHNKFEGRKTACGEIFDQNLFTAAHWKIKMGTYVLVTNRNTGLQVIVKINDRCPKKGVLDMTRRAAHSIGIRGCQPVTVRILPDGYAEKCLAQDALFDSVPSRFASGEYALSNNGSTSKTEKKETKETKTAQKSELPPLTTKGQSKTSGQRYNLILGTVKNHGDAFEMVQKLPEPYQDKTVIDSIGEEIITIMLDVRLDKKKAQELNRALRHTFSNCQITPTD